MKISQIKDKVNIPHKVELQANLKKQWSYPRSWTHNTNYSTEMWGLQRPSMLPGILGIWFPPTSN